MSVLREPVQGIKNAAPQADIFFLLKAHLLSDGIRGFKADSPDVIRKAVGVFLHDLYALVPIGLVDLGRVARADIMALEKEHDVLYLFLLLPAAFDPLHPQLPDAGDLDQPVGIFFDHVQCIRAELLHDPLCKFRADSLDKAAPEIFLDPVDGRRQCLLVGFHRKLPAVFCIHLPAAGQRQYAPDVYLRHGADDGHQILVTLCAALDDGIPVLLVLICNSLYDAAKALHSFLSFIFMADGVLSEVRSQTHL